MLEKRSLKLAGHATSLALEPIFWREVERLAKENGKSVNAFIASLDSVPPEAIGEPAESGHPNLASRLRVHIVNALLRETGRT